MEKFFILLMVALNLVQLSLGQCLSPYTVTWGDTCLSIAERAGLSFTSFIALNKPITCTALQYGQQLCLARVGFTPYPKVACTNKYTLQSGETCDSISYNSRTALSTIFAYNPGLDCSALQYGQQICLDNIPPSLFPTYAPTPAPTTAAPTTTLPPTLAPLTCAYPYTVNFGDTCLSIAERAGLSFTSFIALNKPITCTALQPGQQVCLARQGFTPYPKEACTNKYTIQSGETCDSISYNSRTALSTIFAYNPGLDCSALQYGQQICLDNMPPSLFPTLAPTTAPTTTAPIITIPTTVSPYACTAPYTISSGDTCLSIAERAGISFTTFIALNKPITCSALQPGQQVCLARQGVTPFRMVQCINKYTVQPGDTCDTISYNTKMNLAYIYYFNPGLDCTALQPGQYICLDNV